jgi:hypothetical protein
MLSYEWQRLHAGADFHHRLVERRLPPFAAALC